MPFTINVTSITLYKYIKAYASVDLLSMAIVVKTPELTL